jgi:hypothetical protein
MYADIYDGTLRFNNGAEVPDGDEVAVAGLGEHFGRDPPGGQVRFADFQSVQRRLTTACLGRGNESPVERHTRYRRALDDTTDPARRQRLHDGMDAVTRDLILHS